MENPSCEQLRELRKITQHSTLQVQTLAKTCIIRLTLFYACLRTFCATITVLVLSRQITQKTTLSKTQLRNKNMLQNQK